MGKRILALPESSKVCDSLEVSAISKPCYSEQHTELRDSTRNRDFNDLQKLLNWLEINSPFDNQISSLMSISSGTVASNVTNCDSAKEIGENLIRKCIGKDYQDLRLKRNDKVKPLSFMFKTLKEYAQEAQVNPRQLLTEFFIHSTLKTL